MNLTRECFFAPVSKDIPLDVEIDQEGVVAAFKVDPRFRRKRHRRLTI